MSPETDDPPSPVHTETADGSWVGPGMESKVTVLVIIRPSMEIHANSTTKLTLVQDLHHRK